MPRSVTFSAIAVPATLGASAAFAHDDHCTAVAASVTAAGFDDSVSVNCTDTHAILPAHNRHEWNTPRALFRKPP